MTRRLLPILAAMVMASPAHAAEPLPGDACSAVNNLLFTSGPEVSGGGGHAMLCQGGTWKSILSFNNVAGVTKFGNLACTNGQILKFNGSSWTCAADNGGTLPGLSSAQMWVGNASNAATAVAMSGDATLSNAGVLTIASNAIGSAEITDASIGLGDLAATGTKNSTTFLRGDNTWATISTGLPSLTSANIWVGNASNAATAVTMSGDATLSNTGVLTIAGNAIGSAEITDGTIANADLAGSIALSKLAITGTANSSVFLRGDGTWAAPPSGADNLGNHTATQALAMGNYDVTGIRQIVGGFGALSTAGTLDWNDVTNARSGSGYSLLLGNATNGPGTGGYYYHPFSFEYATKDGSGNLTQFAIPYGDAGALDRGVSIRGRYQGTWSSWRKILTENASGNIAVTGTLSATSLSGSGASLTSLNAASLATGTVATARLGSGTANSSVFLRGDGTWAAPPSGADNLGNHTATTSLTMANNAIVNAGQISTGPWNATYDVWYQGGPNGSSGGARNLAILGTDNDSGDTLYLNYSSEYSGGTIIGGPVSVSNGLSFLSGNLSLGSGALTSSAGTVIDGAGGWHRTYGNTGWYNGTHGGGWNMEDSTWLRAYGGKGVYTTNVVRADSGVRTNQVCDINGGNCIAQGALGGSGGGVTAAANASCSVTATGNATCSATCPAGYFAASGVVVANGDKFPCMGSTSGTANGDCWFSSNTAVSIQNAGWGAVARTLHVRCLK